MNNQININQDSLSLEIDDRFFESQSSQRNQYKQKQISHQNLFKDDGISQMLVFNQNSFKNKFENQNEEDQIFGSNEHYQKSQAYSEKKSKPYLKAKHIQKSEIQTKKYKNNLHLEKKKQNSKNYRQKKKQYFQKLQEQHDYYKKKTIELEQKIKMLETQICELKYDPQNQQKSGYEKQFQIDLEALKGKVSEGVLSNEQLVNIAKDMRKKYGPAGSDRKRILNYYMSEYISHTMADFQKYIFNAVLKKTGIFGEIKTKLDQKIDDIFNLTEIKKQQLIDNVMPSVRSAALSFNSCCRNIYQNYIKLLDQAANFQEKATLGFNFLTMPQLSIYVDWFQKNAHRMEVRKLRQEWIQIFSGEWVDQQQKVQKLQQTKYSSKK